MSERCATTLPVTDDSHEAVRLLSSMCSHFLSLGVSSDASALFTLRVAITAASEHFGFLGGTPFGDAISSGLEGDETAAEKSLLSLWDKMYRGEAINGHKIPRFLGREFCIDAPGMDARFYELAAMLLKLRWEIVEPAALGVLATVSLGRKERHRLGSEYTPVAYAERLVGVTIGGPLRREWRTIKNAALELLSTGNQGDAALALSMAAGFHNRLLSTKVLDPACGCGNFLYIAMRQMKALELEVISLISDADPTAAGNAHGEVNISQFHGLEVNPIAKWVASGVMCLAYNQFKTNNNQCAIPDIACRELGEIVLGDALLSWDLVQIDPIRGRPDPNPTIVDANTGKMVPDPTKRLDYEVYRGARQTEWPMADFIVGNPPYMGSLKMRDSFGDGYVEALRGAYKALPAGIDLAMYWWYRAAMLVATGETRFSGMVTTAAIKYARNRRVLGLAIRSGAEIAWAVPDHPWDDGPDGASVRVAMTLVAKEGETAAAKYGKIDDLV